MITDTRHILALAILAISITPALAASDNSVSLAYGLCKVMDGTGLTSKPCEVSGWRSSVNVTIHMSVPEAREMCNQMVTALRQQGMRWSSGWTLQIYSPLSGDNSIAFCNLPN